MAINNNFFIHESDKAALQALKAIPGFTQVVRSFMKAWNEKLMYIENMATNIKLSRDQLPKYYEMLGPICEKLGIEEPDLFLKLDVVPNAWTSGDSKPYIVITSGLLETLPDELIGTVLAHECGHIACHHVLYRTMGTLILNGAFNFIPLANIAIYPIKAAFAYWMRCSELSADRAAALCEGSIDKVTEMCMRFAGFDKNIPYEMNLEAFMNQALEYKELVDNSAFNKTLEFMMFKDFSHPINAVRAYEINKWGESEEYIKANQYFNSAADKNDTSEFPLVWSKRYFVGRNYREVYDELIGIGFSDVSLVRESGKLFFAKSESVLTVTIDGCDKYEEGDWVNKDVPVEIKYYLPLTDEEIAALHPDEIKMVNSSYTYRGLDVNEVRESLINMGFKNIFTSVIFDNSDSKYRAEGKVANVIVDKKPKFYRGDWISKDALIEIEYYSKM